MEKKWKIQNEEGFALFFFLFSIFFHFAHEVEQKVLIITKVPLDAFFSPRKEEHKIFDYSQTMRRQLYKQKQPSRQLVMKMPQCHTAILETYLFYHSRPSNVNKYCRFACSYHLFFCPGLAFSFSVSQKFSIILDVILRTNIIDVWIKHGIYVAAPYIIRTRFKCVMKLR